MWFAIRIGLTLAVYQIVNDFAGKEMTSQDSHFWPFLIFMCLLIITSNLEGYFDAKKKAKS